MIPRFRFFGKVADGAMRMVLADYIDFKNKFVYYRYHVYTVEGGDHEYGDVIGFEDCILMQSTGLIDSVRKEIFEGDILSIESDEGNIRVIVFWDDKHALFMFESEKYNEKVALSELFEDNSYQFNIIGNIYENPELLEERL